MKKTEPLIALYRSHSKQGTTYPTATLVFNTPASRFLKGWTYVKVWYMAEANAIIIEPSDKLFSKKVGHVTTFNRYDSRIHAQTIAPASWPTRQQFDVYMWGDRGIALVPSPKTTVHMLGK